MEGIVVGKDNIPVIDDALSKMIADVTMGEQITNESESDFFNQAVVYIQNNKHNQVTSTYYLIVKKMEREMGGGRNLVFEKVQRDKKKYAASAGNLSIVNFSSPSH